MPLHNREEKVQVSVSLFFCFCIYEDHMFSQGSSREKTRGWVTLGFMFCVRVKFRHVKGRSEGLGIHVVKV